MSTCAPVVLNSHNQNIIHFPTKSNSLTSQCAHVAVSGSHNIAYSKVEQSYKNNRYFVSEPKPKQTTHDKMPNCDAPAINEQEQQHTVTPLDTTSSPETLYSDYAQQRIDASYVNIESANIVESGIDIDAATLKQFNLGADSEATMLMMPGLLIMTNHPKKQEIMRAIEELQYRQDELKVDFSRAILALIRSMEV